MVRDGIDYRTTYRTTLRIFDIVQKVAPAGERKLFWYNRETLTRAGADRAAWALYKLQFKRSAQVRPCPELLAQRDVHLAWGSIGAATEHAALDAAPGSF